jgi:hypothetical protein
VADGPRNEENRCESRPDSDQNEKHTIEEVVDELSVEEKEPSSFHTASHNVLHYTSPSLRTLFIHYTIYQRQKFPFILHAPTSLTFPVTSAYSSFATAQTFPALKLLH